MTSGAGDFVPHTDDDIAEMLAAIGCTSVDHLFDPIPSDLRDPAIDLPEALDEPSLVRHVSELASRNVPAAGGLNFLGGGIYDHYVPAAVRSLMSRGEFATAYTPYQAEASQGTLQTLFEFQTMVSELFGLPASNASLYDGGTALVEAVNLAAMRRPARRVLVAPGVNVRYRRVLETYADGLGVNVEVLPENDLGCEPGAIAEAVRDEPVLAVVVQQPNAYGFLEEAAELSEAASDGDAVVIAVADPMSLGILAPPGEWGAHIAIAEGRALGNAMSLAGQCVGLFACDDSFARHMPGRIVGETVDAEGRRGYVLTMQAREQHIKREKAGSNICTNQTLFALGVAFHLAWLGPEGLRRIGEDTLNKAHLAAGLIDRDTPFRIASSRSFVREFALRGPKPAREVIGELHDRGVWVGPASPDHEDVFNVALTENRTTAEIAELVDALREVGKS
jgi:glycine dehydrogenase subunit 1